MILVKPSFEILSIMKCDDYTNQSSLRLIEKAGRTCYKSENMITESSNIKFVEMINKRGHESVLEHSAMTVKFICDRGVTHELVRHRLCAFSQESTRYVNYKGGCTFVIPPWSIWSTGEYQDISDTTLFPDEISYSDTVWLKAMLKAEKDYLSLIKEGWTPQQARSVLPNSTKTEIVVTANFREWKHIFKLRTSKAAHPQIREIMIPLLVKSKELIPVIFDNINEER